MNAKKKLLLAAIPAVMLSACATTQQVVDIPDQNTTVASSAKARIYVMRPSIIGAASGFTVYDGKQFIGMTYSKGCLSWERKPGKVELVSKGENTSKLNFTAYKGMTYYFKQNPAIGLMGPRNNLVKISSEQGKKYLETCKMAKKK